MRQQCDLEEWWKRSWRTMYHRVYRAIEDREPTLSSAYIQQLAEELTNAAMGDAIRKDLDEPNYFADAQHLFRGARQLALTRVRDNIQRIQRNRHQSLSDNNPEEQEATPARIDINLSMVNDRMLLRFRKSRCLERCFQRLEPTERLLVLIDMRNALRHGEEISTADLNEGIRRLFGGPTTARIISTLVYVWAVREVLRVLGEQDERLQRLDLDSGLENDLGKRLGELQTWQDGVGSQLRATGEWFCYTLLSWGTNEARDSLLQVLRKRHASDAMTGVAHDADGVWVSKIIVRWLKETQQTCGPVPLSATSTTTHTLAEQLRETRRLLEGNGALDRLIEDRNDARDRQDRLRFAECQAALALLQQLNLDDAYCCYRPDAVTEGWAIPKLTLALSTATNECSEVFCTLAEVTGAEVLPMGSLDQAREACRRRGLDLLLYYERNVVENETSVGCFRIRLVAGFTGQVLADSDRDGWHLAPPDSTWNALDLRIRRESKGAYQRFIQRLARECPEELFASESCAESDQLS